MTLNTQHYKNLGDTTYSIAFNTVLKLNIHCLALYSKYDSIELNECPTTGFPNIIIFLPNNFFNNLIIYFSNPVKTRFNN